MGIPRIPDAKEIADMTAKAMEPMMAKLDSIDQRLDKLGSALDRLVEIEEARDAYADAILSGSEPPAGPRGASRGAAMRIVK